jgi:hypothetical protein
MTAERHRPDRQASQVQPVCTTRETTSTAIANYCTALRFHTVLIERRRDIVKAGAEGEEEICTDPKIDLVLPQWRVDWPPLEIE